MCAVTIVPAMLAQVRIMFHIAIKIFPGTPVPPIAVLMTPVVMTPVVATLIIGTIFVAMLTAIVAIAVIGVRGDGDDQRGKKTTYSNGDFFHLTPHR